MLLASCRSNLRGRRRSWAALETIPVRCSRIKPEMVPSQVPTYLTVVTLGFDTHRSRPIRKRIALGLQSPSSVTLKGVVCSEFRLPPSTPFGSAIEPSSGRVSNKYARLTRRYHCYASSYLLLVLSSSALAAWLSLPWSRRNPNCFWKEQC